MAKSGLGFFDRRGQFFRSPDEATASDLASLLGRIGDGDSLAPGIANMLIEKRDEIEAIFSEHDSMTSGVSADHLGEINLPSMDTVRQLPSRN